MRCSKVRALIALSESGDVSADESRRVTDHVARCPGCRRLAAADPLPFAALRTSVPLRDDGYAAVRARVLAGLTSDRRSPFIIPFRLATAAVLSLLLGIGALLMNRPAVEDRPKPGMAEAAPSAAILEPTAAAVVAAVDAAPPDAAPASVAHAEPRVAPPIRPVPRVQTPAVESETALAAFEAPQELRIQIQTSDPGIRIIWIVNPSHEFEPTSLEDQS
jgi:hypothetical protein